MVRAYRKSPSATIQQEHDIFDGAAKILRNKASGDVWQFRMWIAEEQKYVRKTLKTRDMQTALERGKTLYHETYSDVKTGKKIFGITLGELIDQYLEWRREDAKVGNITKERVVTLQSQLKHMVAYKNKSLKLAELDRMSMYDYANARKLKHPSVRDETIINECPLSDNLRHMAV